jgi:serine/threonine-protein kinase
VAVLFEIVGPWTPASRDPGQANRQGGSNPIFIYVLLGAAAYAAWRNVRRGRADMTGAFRLATFTFFLTVSIWIVSPHVEDLADEQQRFFVSVGLALFVAGALYLLYLGLEPFVRRSWPTMLVGWSRLLAGRIRDPLIGRDILVGAAIGATLALMNLATDLVPPIFGMPPPTPHLTNLGSLLNTRSFVLTILGSINAGLQNALITVFEFAVLRALFEWLTQSGARWSGKRWTWGAKLTMSDRTSERVFIVFCVTVLGLISFLGSGPVGPRLIASTYLVIATGITLIVLLRVGILASAIMFGVNFLLLRMPLTLDGNALYAASAWIAITAVIGLAAAGLWMARTSGSLIPHRSSCFQTTSAKVLSIRLKKTAPPHSKTKTVRALTARVRRSSVPVPSRHQRNPSITPAIGLRP